jgi:hypothetical protein
VATDLVLIAHVRGDGALRSAVATALGTTPEELGAMLDTELSAARGLYRPPADNARRALAALDADTPGGALGAVGGSQGRVLRLRSMARALRDGDDPMQLLAALGTDPCAEDSCEGIDAELDPESRRAADALRTTGEDIRALRRAARSGDPLARELAGEVEAVAMTVRRVSLTPVARLPEGVALPLVEQGSPVRPDMVLIVGARSLRYGFTPRVQLVDGARVALTHSREPTLPQTRELALPESFRPYMTPMEAVDELLARQERDGQTLRVAVGATADAQAHLLGRVLLSLRRAGRDHTWLLARSEGGFARGARVALVSKRSDDLRDAPLRVRVRLGGYSLHVGGDYHDIPRIRDDQGLRFDLVTLERELSSQHVARADVSFMADVASGNLTPAVFGVARRSEAVRLVFP